MTAEREREGSCVKVGCDSSVSMALDGFNNLLHKLRESHDREVQKWQEKLQELTNKKGCDTKRMEELFNRNQQLREQQRLLTDNIKQLENRLRAGLCDRCTVTQDVAKRRQQEYETSQIQSLQHISIMAGEMNMMKKENQRLREDVRHLRVALESQSGHSSSQDATPEVRYSADLSPSAMPHILTAIRSINQPPEGATAGLSIVKTETDHSLSFRVDETLPECRDVRGLNGKQSYESHKLLSMSTPITQALRPEHSTARGNTGQKRAHSVEVVDHQRSPVAPTIPHLLLVQKDRPLPSSSSFSSSLSTSSSLPGDEKHSRHLVHAPVPYWPHPIKSARLSLPWPLPEHSDWVTVATSVDDGLVSQSKHNPNLPRFPNLQTYVQQNSSLGKAWLKPSHPPQASLTRSLSTEHGERPTAWVQDHDRRVAPHSWREAVVQAEMVFGDSLKEADCPLDLSDPGRSKSIKSLQDSKASPALQDSKASPTLQDSKASPTLQDMYIEGETSNRTTRTDSPPQSQACPPSSSSSSSSTPALPSSSSSTCPTSQQRQSPNNHNLKEEEQPEKEEAEGKVDQKTGKDSEDRKVPVLTISLRPVVLLEALNSGLQKQLFSNGKFDVRKRNKALWSPGGSLSAVFHPDCNGDGALTGTEGQAVPKTWTERLPSDCCPHGSS
ncbi:RBBP8 N-terminal-like protein isoform X1 [Oncorhynchus tshawytscha]|uniref:DNA endonuclease Ctp1 N-terminal domain-containing protein n=1 Tax=Oncorhynchus tshawytscha TaxID=74940 RepID=A0AAZ3QP83_ONCTS|nr:RBBP8 N-terminal-like protein isoform X1 [Oncorhynchus tshawytscha]